MILELHAPSGYFLPRRFTTPATPSSPVPNNAIVLGSGTVVGGTTGGGGPGGGGPGGGGPGGGGPGGPGGVTGGTIGVVVVSIGALP
ncbi:MAG TPA: hypothetical protein VII66_03690 [Gemmatimonadaceae bacterium]